MLEGNSSLFTLTIWTETFRCPVSSGSRTDLGRIRWWVVCSIRVPIIFRFKVMVILKFRVLFRVCETVIRCIQGGLAENVGFSSFWWRSSFWEESNLGHFRGHFRGHFTLFLVFLGHFRRFLGHFRQILAIFPSCVIFSQTTLYFTAYFRIRNPTTHHQTPVPRA